MDILDFWNITEPLHDDDLDNLFKPLLKKIHKKLEVEWKEKHCNVDKQILTRFWSQFISNEQATNNCKRWINLLQKHVPNGDYSINICLDSFNQTIVALISKNLGYIVSKRKR